MKLVYLLFLLIPLSAIGQFKKLKSFELSEQIVSASIDRAGEIYLATTSGQIQKFDTNGVLKQLYKTSPPPTLFDPRDGARMFSFYRHNRSYTYLNPSFESSNSYLIDTAYVIEPWLVCPSGDFNIWCIDSVDATLKKINTRTMQIEVDVQIKNLDKVTDISSLREYQGFVFMLKKGTGILIFNGLGKPILTIQGKDITAFNFLGEELYYTQKDKLKFFDLFSAEPREIKLPEFCNFALITDERLILIEGKVVKNFEFKP